MEEYIADERTLKSLEVELPQMLIDKDLTDFTIEKMWQSRDTILIKLWYEAYDYPLAVEYDFDLNIAFQPSLPEIDRRANKLNAITNRDALALLRLLYVVGSSCALISVKNFMKWKDHCYHSISLQFKEDNSGRLAVYGRH